MPQITVRDVELYYEEYGQGEPLLLLHGLGSSTRDWQPQLEAFKQDFRVIAVDIRGHGKSSKPPAPYSIQQFADDITGLMDALDIAAAHVIGWSMGGGIAFQMAVSNPERLLSLTIVNSSPEVLPRSPRQRLQIMMRFFIVRLLGMRKMGEVLAKRLFVKPEQENLRAIFIERWAENDKRAYIASMQAMVNWSVMDKIQSIKVPTHIIGAEYDYTPVDYKKAYAANIPGAKVTIIPDTRHALPTENPEAFNQVAKDFLATLSTKEQTTPAPEKTDAKIGA